ncbi:MAG: transglutaminase-like domain-containing protein [Bacteroidales bacterium]|nr:transglutaminase-like domain-containing protein [Bacteroidales bacterium]
MKKVLLLMLTTCLLASCGSHFITDKAYRENTSREFEQRKFMFADDPVFSQSMSNIEREALEWMYASMSLADIVDHDGNFYLENIRTTLRAKQEMPWCDSIPEDIFRHFVMPVRVNNENLDSFRTVYYDTLAARVKGMTMYEAALEVNHWCHEQVTYRPTDGRTSSPMATMKTSFGRCGEESVFAAAAMRTVGIPARQVYTPRWAHTDDNHAWIEVFVDGKWWFMGACEPEAVLNLAWFNAPVARAMLLHTSVFGDYQGKEDVIVRTKCYTTINVVDGYLPTKRSTITVVDEQDKPVAGAKVKFKIYNYAEFYTVAEMTADENGQAALTTGVGDILVWATDNQHFAIERLAAEQTEMTVKLTHTQGKNFTAEFDMIPPKEGIIETDVTPEQAEENKVRLAQEDAIREAYMATFVKNNEQNDAVTTLLAAAYGNHATIQRVFDNYPERRNDVIALLNAISEKDLRDVSYEVLADALDNTTTSNDSLWAEYVLCPRVEGEMLTPHREQLSKLLEAPVAVEQIIDYVAKNVQLLDEYNPQRLRITPAGVGRAKMADMRSRNIFFVALCRTYGIAARLDLVTGKTQYFKPQIGWVDVSFDNETTSSVVAPQGTLQATYTPSAFLPNPTYYRHFTIAKINNCEDKLLEFDEGENTELGAEASWETMLKQGMSLDEGYYMTTTGTRLANGGVLAHIDFFSVEKEQTTVFPLVMRQESEELQVLGFINAEAPVYLPLNASEPATLLSATGRGYFLVAILGDGDEPTNHALRDFSFVAPELNQWNRKLLFLSAKQGDAERMVEKYGEHLAELSNIACYGADYQGSTTKMITEALNVSRFELPIVVVADSFGRVVFFSQGYNTSLGTQIKQVITKL